MSGFNTGVGNTYHHGWVTAVVANILPDDWMVAVDQVRPLGARAARL
jgi:hypothetical protein